MKVKPWIRFLNRNWYNILNSPYKKGIFKVLQIEIARLFYKRSKLYLGKVEFQHKPYYFNEILVGYIIEMVYTRQDMTRYKERELEVLLDRWTFKYDLLHFSALFFMLYWILKYTYRFCKKVVIRELHTFFCRYDHYDQIIKISLEQTVFLQPIEPENSLLKYNYLIVDLIVDLISYFDLLL